MAREASLISLSRVETKRRCRDLRGGKGTRLDGMKCGCGAVAVVEWGKDLSDTQKEGKVQLCSEHPNSDNKAGASRYLLFPSTDTRGSHLREKVTERRNRQRGSRDTKKNTRQDRG